LKAAAAEIAAAKRPVILAGHGVLHAQAWDDLVAFAEKAQIPVAWTLLGIGVIDETHPLAYGYMGMHGWKHVNRAIQAADLIVAVGMRFDDRVTGNVRTYAPYARIVHVDIDPAEIGKNVAVDVPVVGDAKRVLATLTPMVERAASAGRLGQGWSRKSRRGVRRVARRAASADYVVSASGRPTTRHLRRRRGQNQMWQRGTASATAHLGSNLGQWTTRCQQRRSALGG
jgi:acetolactate synthase-1/2/3 large subunit